MSNEVASYIFSSDLQNSNRNIPKTLPKLSAFLQLFPLYNNNDIWPNLRHWLPQSLPDMKVTNKCVNRNGIWLYQIRGLNPMGPCHTHVPHFLLEWKVCWCKGKITWNFAFKDCFPEAVGMVGAKNIIVY